MAAHELTLSELAVAEGVIRPGEYVALSYRKEKSPAVQRCGGPIQGIFKKLSGCPHPEYPYRLRLLDVADRAQPRSFHISADTRVSGFRSVAVVGAPSSGKSCLMTTLIRYIKMELSLPHARMMSVEFNDSKSEDVYLKHENRIYRERRAPQPTQDVGVMHLSLRFDVARWLRRSAQGVVSLVLPDVNGEVFTLPEREDKGVDAHLAHAQAILLVVDPLAYREGYASAESAMQKLVRVVRGVQERGKLDRLLAVVVAKADQCPPDADGLFGPAPRGREGWEAHSKVYDPAVGDEISKKVQHFLLQHNHQWPGLVALAQNTYEHVAYFAVSALGQNPDKGKELKQQVVSRRIAEPLLWILHKWGQA